MTIELRLTVLVLTVLVLTVLVLTLQVGACGRYVFRKYLEIEVWFVCSAWSKCVQPICLPVEVLDIIQRRLFDSASVFSCA
jgi:hypothetical protein